MSKYPHDIILDYDVPKEGRPIVIASVYYDDNDFIPPRQANANARLFAASPCLLEALEGMLELWQTVGGDQGNYWVEKAEAAIKKARGQK